MNRQEIMEILPHRDPFLLIDEILECEPGLRVKAIKKVDGGEYFFAGHFPGFPVMPGVLVIEALAQAGAVAILSLEENKGKLGFLTGIEQAKFRQKVIPGDILELEVVIEKFKMGMGIGKGVASVGGRVVASAVIKFSVQAN
ncbi:MAG: 3-hydroxyacyl-ACP dehydratase FabZ [Oscillospiraceae bacterium]|nr:3-hydroxyacyl-ACP dehydratase FabZ [Oscillospiraceae bacterium]